MGKKPETLITDGLSAYMTHSISIRQTTQNQPHKKHQIHEAKNNNNKMERMNGEIRDREKTMRGLKTKDTAILTGYQLFQITLDLMKP